MDLSQIRYFVCVARNLSFSRAAKELYVTQPTISKQISLLEQELGVKLFSRNNQTTRLTVWGETLYPRLVEALGIIDSAVREVTVGRFDMTGEVKIGIRDMMDINYVVPGFIKSFNESFPNIKISIISHKPDLLIEKLNSGELDVIFTTNLLSGDESIHGRIKVSRTHTFLYYSSEFRVPGGKPSLKSFLDSPLIICPVQGTLDYYERLRKERGIVFKKVIEADNTATLMVYVESGLGFCILGRSFSRINFNSNIRSIDLTETEGFPLSGMDAIWLKENNGEPLGAFLDMLEKN